MEQDSQKKMDLFNECEKLNERIKNIEVSLSNEKLLESVKVELSIAESFTKSDNNYDVGTFSKILSIKGLGRNNFFEYLRSKKILLSNNQPYQRYAEYFKVIPIENRYTHKTDYKTMIKANGVKYIFNKLIKDGKVIPKKFEDIVKELQNLETAN